MSILLYSALVGGIILFFRHYGAIMKRKTIALGSLHTQELTILEFKPLFSMKLFYFQPGEAQDVFHTHSFTACSLLIFGNYWERFFDPVTRLESELPRNRARIIYIPRDRFHQITRSSGCLTLMVTGPWGNTYKEYYANTHRIVVSTHGRRQIDSYSLQ